jgi:hypothetical protein
MALDKTRLKNALKQAYLDMEAADLDEDQGLDLFCEKLADAVVDEVKQLHINYTSGLTAPGGAVGGTINHTVS